VTNSELMVKAATLFGVYIDATIFGLNGSTRCFEGCWP
jgi:hypothetical protein